VVSHASDAVQEAVIAVARRSRCGCTQLALTGLRKIIGQPDLDEILRGTHKKSTPCWGQFSGSTAPWGLLVERFEMRTGRMAGRHMQQVMAMQAEAIREKRARIIKAEAEMEASVNCRAAAAQITANPPPWSCAACK